MVDPNKILTRIITENARLTLELIVAQEQVIDLTTQLEALKQQVDTAKAPS